MGAHSGQITFSSRSRLMHGVLGEYPIATGYAGRRGLTLAFVRNTPDFPHIAHLPRSTRPGRCPARVRHHKESGHALQASRGPMVGYWVVPSGQSGLERSGRGLSLNSIQNVVWTNLFFVGRLLNGFLEWYIAVCTTPCAFRMLFMARITLLGTPDGGSAMM